MHAIPQDMTAAFIDAPGGRITIGRRPVPACSPGDVLCRVEALAVNHVDTFIRSGAYATPLPRPFIIGRDFVGRVVATGAATDGFKPGDRVWCNSLGHDGRQGSFADYALAPAQRLYPLPPGQDAACAVSLLHTGATAWLGLFREGAVQRGRTVFIGGAGGGVGSAAVQLAVRAGARVIATTSLRDIAWVQGCGAEVVLDYHDLEVMRQIAAAAPDGIDLYWGQSGHHDLDTALPLLARGGRLIVTAGMDARPALPVGALYTRDASLRGFAISNASIADLARAAEALNACFAAGGLKTRIAAQFALRDAAAAFRLMEQGRGAHAKGRIVVLP